MIDSYITVAGSSNGEILISKSRFIGYAVPCEKEEDAVSFIQKLRDEHKCARHHCYAYIIGENSGIMRYSDDGEPGGTAGLPIMEVLKQRKIVNCCIVVVRYFGGVLLGTGGLVRAYTQAAQAAVDAAGVVRMELTGVNICELPYSSWDRFRYAAEHLPVKIDNVEYAQMISFHIIYRVSDREFVISRLMEATDRKLSSIPKEEIYAPWKVE